MIADGKMDVQLDVSKASRVSRLEVIEGPTGRRNRSAAEKAKIAAESSVPGAQVATVARKHGVTRWQVYDWRRRLQRGRLSLPDSLAATFAPLMLDEMPKTRVDPCLPTGTFRFQALEHVAIEPDGDDLFGVVTFGAANLVALDRCIKFRKNFAEGTRSLENRWIGANQFAGSIIDPPSILVLMNAAFDNDGLHFLWFGGISIRPDPCRIHRQGGLERIVT